MSFRFIADEITESERAAGFKEKNIENPNGYYFSEKPQIPAIIYEAGPYDRIIKLVETNGIPYYRHQRYGLWPFQSNDDKAAWLPCGDEYWFRPEDAVDAVKQKIGKDCGSISIKIKEPSQ